MVGQFIIHNGNKETLGKARWRTREDCTIVASFCKPKIDSRLEEKKSIELRVVGSRE